LRYFIGVTPREQPQKRQLCLPPRLVPAVSPVVGRLWAARRSALRRRLQRLGWLAAWPRVSSEPRCREHTVAPLGSQSEAQNVGTL